MFIRLALSVSLAATICSAQTLQLTVEPVDGTKSGNIAVQLVPGTGKEPVALQWDLAFPETILIDPHAIATESASKAGKSINCRVLPNRQGKVQTCRCILAGGMQSIPAGSISAIKYSAARGARPGSYELQIKNALAVTNDMKNDMKKVPLKEARGTAVLPK